MSQTLRRSAENVKGDLLRSLPEALRAASAVKLPARARDLLRAAIVDELFSFDLFQGVLGHLKAQIACAFDEVVKDRAPLAESTNISLPKGCEALVETPCNPVRTMAAWQ